MAIFQKWESILSFVFLLSFIVAIAYSQSPPSITSYTVGYRKHENGLTPSTGLEYYSSSTDQFHIEDSEDDTAVSVMQQGATYVGFDPSTGYCETYCAHHGVCPPNPYISCSAGHTSYFIDLVNATLEGSLCADGSEKWVAIDDQGTANEYSSTYCITSAGIPRRLSQKFVSQTTLFFDINFTSFAAGEPDPSLFIIPPTCACV